MLHTPQLGWFWKSSFLKCFPIGEGFLKKGAVPIVNPDISCPNETLVEDVPVFKDSENKRLEAIFNAFFSLTDPTMQPTVAGISIYQTRLPDLGSILMDQSILQQLELLLWPCNIVLIA